MTDIATRDIMKPDSARILAGLKPFQRRSVDYVYERLYGPQYTRRFLLADEVGLGKTMVARGVIAKAIDHLWNKVERLDIVYICSNHDIARQNINRLNVTGKKDFSLASRITLLPIQERKKEEKQFSRRLNFVSFTPGTSFDLKSSMGISGERALLYHLLKVPWSLRGAAPLNVLQGDATKSFRRTAECFTDWYRIDEHAAAAFARVLVMHPQLRERFDSLCDRFHRTDANVDDDTLRKRGQLIGELRSLLARTCLQSLQPDLIILDEFQRFKHLLSSDSESGQLAHDLFQYSDEHSEARVLLLSATPYKMYTMGHELAEDHHYSDFIETLRFLHDDATKTGEVESLLKEYRRLLYRLRDDDEAARALASVRDKLQTALHLVICRTERLASTADRSGMLREVPTMPRLEPSDVASYLSLQRVAKALEEPDTLEYWKSAPYLLSFMEDYSLKRRFEERLNDAAVRAAIEATGSNDGLALPWESIRSFGDVEPRNPRLRALIDATISCGAWRALWMPPALPYYEMSGPIEALRKIGFTKRLVFSSWQVVPKAIATLVSYAAERRMMIGFDPEAQNTPEARKRQRALLNLSRSEGQLRGMPVLGLLYPSTYLAQRFDPLRLMCDQPEGSSLTTEDVIGMAESILVDELESLIAAAPTSGSVDESWYWAAPILLDLRRDPKGTEEWWNDEGLSDNWSGLDDEDERNETAGAETDEAAEESAWLLHVEEARKLVSQEVRLGRPPADLCRVLAELAVGGPGVCALRALTRISGGITAAGSPDRRHAAGRVGWAFRTLFNSPDVMALIRAMNRDEPYWRRVLEYCVGGCLQAVLDEYAHVLREWLGDADASPEQVAGDVAKAMADSLSVRIASPGVDRIAIDDETKTLRIENSRLRARFAMRFGDERSEDGRAIVSRADQVRKAFNSPFWPFVLVTTSIGQEGLDFHNYCHAVVHWNLPSNPIDLEQREGRVHRYKGHAVRRNVAQRYGQRVSRTQHHDPWEGLFSLALAECGEESSGIAPYWVFPIDGGAVIERHVPALPLSRESEYMPVLRQSLAAYRMVFGQPRQDDLVTFLLQQLSKDRLAAAIDQLTIDLTPRAHSSQQ